jgi:hypothetical protein
LSRRELGRQRWRQTAGQYQGCDDGGDSRHVTILSWRQRGPFRVEDPGLGA